MTADPAPHLIWNVDEMPTDLRSPILIAAFEGWNDAGEASSTAARYVRDHFEAEHVATIDAEDFFDFTVARPNVCIDDNDARQIVWPSTGIHVARIPGSAHDLVCAIGHEPQLRWRTFVDHLAITAEAFGATMVCTLGALLTDVPHSRPTQVYGGTDDAALARRLDLSPSTYEGPTGIVGVLAAGLRDRGVSTASFWASVPAYVSNVPSPKAALALVERLCQVLEVDVPRTDLEIAAAAYVRQVTELVAEDDGTMEYVEQLEADFDEETADDPDSLVAEVEDFLRNQPGT
ncbi:MAG: PAC2 family protein [Acidimicrobiales bacterium]|jgi:proteasome assembly chaperone (PAC2) family protein|nr:PAC2 family protein [Acidimicrobiales bacterium]